MPHCNTRPAPELSPTLRAALRYAAKGCHVFPVSPKTGVAYLSEEKTGRKWGASSDPVVVEKMFRRYPRADIGIATGAISGFFVLDRDNKNGRDGEASLAALLHAYRERWLFAAKASTPNNGLHYYFQHPGRHVHTTTSKLGSGLDVRGDGGMVIAPPSRGRKWISHSSYGIRSAPDWLIKLVCEEREPPRPRNALAKRPSSQPLQLPSPELRELMLQDAGRGLSTDPDDLLVPEDTELKVWCALQVISPDCDYDTWWRTGCAIFAALGYDGKERFVEWSSDAPNRFPGWEACEKKWNECAKSRAIRPETLFWFADQADRRWRTAYHEMLTKEIV
jgi:hypothetical protein